MRKLFLFPILLIGVLLFVGCSPAARTTPEPETAATPDDEAPETEATPDEETPADAEGDPIRVAALLPGRIDDVSFNQAMYEGLVALQEELGDQVEVTYTEDLYEVVDIEPALRDYADQGYDLILGHGFQFQDPIIAVAPEYPDVHFAIGPGAFMTAENVSLYDAHNAQLGYLLGTVAGYATQAGTIGSVGGLEVPNIATIHEAFRLAVEAVNPEAEVVNLYTGDFSDAEATQEAALSMIDQGADVIFASGDGMTFGALEAARSRDVYFMTISDMSELAPEIVLASVPWQFNVAIEEMIADIQADTYGGEQYQLTLQNGGLTLNVHQEEVVEQALADISSIVEGLTEGSLEIPPIDLE